MLFEPRLIKLLKPISFKKKKSWQNTMNLFSSSKCYMREWLSLSLKKSVTSCRNFVSSFSYPIINLINLKTADRMWFSYEKETRSDSTRKYCIIKQIWLAFIHKASLTIIHIEWLLMFSCEFSNLIPPFTILLSIDHFPTVLIMQTIFWDMFYTATQLFMGFIEPKSKN